MAGVAGHDLRSVAGWVGHQFASRPGLCLAQYRTDHAGVPVQVATLLRATEKLGQKAIGETRTAVQAQ